MHPPLPCSVVFEPQAKKSQLACESGTDLLASLRGLQGLLLLEQHQPSGTEECSAHGKVDCEQSLACHSDVRQVQWQNSALVHVHVLHG